MEYGILFGRPGNAHAHNGRHPKVYSFGDVIYYEHLDNPDANTTEVSASQARELDAILANVILKYF